jgi:hypothetical protein
MSGGSLSHHRARSSSHAESWTALSSPETSWEERRRIEQERQERLRRSRAAAQKLEDDRARARQEAERKRKTEQAKREAYSASLVRDTITKPHKDAEEVWIIRIDNSGSNRAIADHLKETAGYLLASLDMLNPKAQLQMDFFSDHCDGPRIMQPVDFVFPNEEGSRTLVSTIEHMAPAHGGDNPEAIECVLHEACNIDFGHIPKEKRHLILVTDELAHGMARPTRFDRDDGCPLQRNWALESERARETFGTFEIVGCSNYPQMRNFQAAFLAEERRHWDIIDLSEVKSPEHRLGIVGNAILFLMARSLGDQAAEMFLAFLYEKWLSDPIFGSNSDLMAREAICRFFKYLEGVDASEHDALAQKIFG